ncbi:MAG: sensor histidine kinase [Solirubrobacterales bacterium]
MRPRALLTQVLVANLLLVTVAVVAAALVAGTGEISEDSPAGIVLAFAIALSVLVNVHTLARRLAPLERLANEMEHADLSRPGSNLAYRDGLEGPEEVRRLQQSFVKMLERLETERRQSASMALEAQEQERARVARDLHDEVNQSLTGLILRLEAVRRKAPAELGDELGETRALANQAMEELVALARQLRPTALDDLGLSAALASNTDELGRQSEIATSYGAAGDFTDLTDEVQLVLYRVAQEALANAAQHSGASSVVVRLAREGNRVELTISDDGSGFAFDDAGGGLGLEGMRERALLVGGELRIESRPEIGTRVRLIVDLLPSPLPMTSEAR